MSDQNELSEEEAKELVRDSSVGGPYDSDLEKKIEEIERKRKEQ